MVVYLNPKGVKLIEQPAAQKAAATPAAKKGAARDDDAHDPSRFSV